MKKIKSFVLIFGILAALLGGVLMIKNWGSAPNDHASHAEDLYYCPMHPNYTSDKAGHCPICNMTLVKRENDHAEDVAPTNASVRAFTVEQLTKMKPGEICLLHKCKMGQCMIAMTEETARLGKCPHCGEDLNIVIKEALPDGYAQIKLGAEKREMIGIKTASVIRKNLQKTIRTVGRVAYDPELYQAQEEYLQALHASTKAKDAAVEIKAQADKLVESSKIKLRLLGLSEELIKEIESVGKADKTLLYSDVGGKAWLYVPIYEYEIPLVKMGDTLRAEVPAIPGTSFEGVIRSIDSVLDPSTRSVRVRAVVDNAKGQLKPEMYVNVTLQIAAGEKLVVPEEAVFSTGDKNIIFVAKGNSEFEPREVELGVKTDNFTEILSGLAEGETVVTSGNFLIDSESRLKAALEGLGGSGGGHQHGG